MEVTADMTDIKSIIAAIRAAGLRGFRYSDSGVVAIDCATDADFASRAASLTGERRVAVVGDKCWDSLDADLDGLALFITGPHRAVKGEAA